MRNIYVFGIGGTGARVIRSMTMLLASGVKLVDTAKVIPIIIDVDAENEDTDRAIKALGLYKKIRSAGYNENAVIESGFFTTDLNTLGSQRTVEDGTIKDSFQLSFSGISDSFENYLKSTDLDAVDEQFLKLLYDASPKSNPNTELKLELTKGFKGNPNIGSIVFNDLVNTPEYKYFENAIGEDDRVFIISSIFGGTGSAGFPQLLKLIKNSRNDRVRRAKIGAITVMPYFSIEEDKKSAIDATRFVSKAKAALSYYNKEMDVLNTMYYIYDKSGSVLYQNKEGGKEQKNDAHIVEAIAATSIFHFINKSNDSFDSSTEFYEFGIKKDDPVIDISHFFDQTRDAVLHPLTLFAYSMKFYLDYLPTATTEAFAKELNLAKELKDGTFYKNLEAFYIYHFKAWLEELERNNRTFKPFNLKGDFNSFITGKSISTGIFNKGISKSFLDENFGKQENVLKKTITENEKRFMQLINRAAAKCFEKLESLPSKATH